MDFIRGIKAGIPIWMGYIPIAIAYGVLGKSSGLDNVTIVSMSVLVYAGASQFIAVNLFAAGIPAFEIILTTFMINIRHMIMSASLSMKVKDNVDKKIRMLIAFGITDETFSLTSILGEKEKLSHSFLLGVNISAYIAWISGGIIGILFSQIIPESLQSSMGIALYAMFIALLIPSIQKSRIVLVVAISGGILHIIIVYLFNVSNGWTILSASVASAFLGTLLMTEEKEVEQ